MADNKTREIMSAAMDVLTKIFPGKGLVLLVIDTGSEEGRRTNYISNCQRDDMRVAMKEILARWEGRILGSSSQQ